MSGGEIFSSHTRCDKNAKKKFSEREREKTYNFSYRWSAKVRKVSSRFMRFYHVKYRRWLFGMLFSLSYLLQYNFNVGEQIVGGAPRVRESTNDKDDVGRKKIRI